MTDRSAETSFAAAELDAVCRRVLAALGTPADLAAITADALVTANLRGHDSHGVQRLLQYAGWIANGQVDPAGRPERARTRGGTAVVDGHWGLGQPAARLATRTAAELAAEHGVSAVTITRCNHIGRLGEYVETLAGAGCVGLAFCNSGPIVAPSGGSRRTFGTNPLAWAAPRAGGPALVLDFSTAAAAEGKVRLSLARAEPVAPGTLIDAGGRPSTDPADLYAGGALLPFGGHKGSGLSFMIELVGGLLSGMGAAPMPDYGGGNGTVLLALSVDAFTDPAGFAAGAAAFADRVHEAPGGGREPAVFLPGEVETTARTTRSTAGIPVPDTIRLEVTALLGPAGAELGRFALLPTDERTP
ncbi:MAG TPA: Ldh family oxidoreductase [Mycobacteriales bacterium]|jgi:LDH2 family malate/lactate/ureidoglycolate dehydrogenase|nr:Ldh family oxidoreductase [Mycobacteriales bacterium]